MTTMIGVFALLAASISMLAAPVAAGQRNNVPGVSSSTMNQAEEDALVARVEARIRYAMSQPQYRTATNPVGVIPMHESFESDDTEHSVLEDSVHVPSTYTTPWSVIQKLRSSSGRSMLNSGNSTETRTRTSERERCKEGRDDNNGNGADTQCKKTQKTRSVSLETINTDEVTCIARTTVREVVRTQDTEIHASAVAEAFKLACEKGDDVTVEDFDSVFKSKDAFAFADTLAKVMLTCSGTSDSVYKCVSITASANAYAEATAVAHASAVSNAVSACGCLTEAVADVLTGADVYAKLVAEAASTATSEVCVTGTKLVKKTEYDTCVSSVYGKLFAEATAEAIVLGNCLSAAAVSDVLAEASLDVTTDSTCGKKAEAIQFDPNEDGPVLSSGPDEAAAVAAKPLTDPKEEKKAEEVAETLIEVTPVDDSPKDVIVLDMELEKGSENGTENDEAVAENGVDENKGQDAAEEVGYGDVEELAEAWKQCGGQGWTGPTKCVAGFTCGVHHKHYSQCLQD